MVFICSTGLVFVRTAFFDILDMQGDRIVGKETIPIIIGEKRTMVMLKITLVAIFWPRAGAGLLVLCALLAIGFFDVINNPTMLLLIAPLVGLAALYWFGRPQPRALAAGLAVALPLLTLIIAGISPAIRVSQRLDDGDLQARLVEGNGVTLVWAPDGPGWPRSGENWFDAQQVCRFLDEDGLALSAAPQEIWRLPTVEEAVRSMARHGRNSGGVWDAAAAQTTYETTPDKESPLWNIHSQVIYWWTSTEVDDDRAYIIVYDGRVWPRSKQINPDYLGFRCVKEP